MPGTCGALLGVPIYVGIAWLTPEGLHFPLIALALYLSCMVTVVLTPWAERYWKKKDPGNFVTDEVAGFLFTVLLFRVPSIWITVLWAFPLTRVLDMIKVPPAKRLEHLPGGWGVLADDLMASFYVAVLLYTLVFFMPGWFGLPA
jgi:phosphatidylglycerophosphatase A